MTPSRANAPSEGASQRRTFDSLPRRQVPAVVACKRYVDVALALTGIALSSPLQVLAGLAVLLDDGLPVLFRQVRVGRDGTPFELLKFRTMKVNSLPPANLQVTSNHPLLTRSGRLLRPLRVDELPQLFNVLRGDMSLIGPRPALPEHCAAYDPWQRKRLLVRPGMTGWAQVNGNVSLTWPERILLDVWYVDHWSPWLDLQILGKTLLVILLGERPNWSAVSEARAYAAGPSRRS